MKKSFWKWLPPAALFLIIFSFTIFADEPAIQASSEPSAAEGASCPEESDAAPFSDEAISFSEGSDAVTSDDAISSPENSVADPSDETGLPPEVSSEPAEIISETDEALNAVSADDSVSEVLPDDETVSQNKTDFQDDTAPSDKTVPPESSSGNSAAERSSAEAETIPDEAAGLAEESPLSSEPASSSSDSELKNRVSETVLPANAAASVSEARISIKDAVVTGIKNRVYTGERIKPALKVYIKRDGVKTLLTEGIDYEVLTSYAKNVGTAHVTVRGIGKYKGDVKNTFQILPAVIRAARLKHSSLRYTGEPRTQTGSILVKARVNKQAVVLKYKRDYTVSYKKNIRVGTATVIIKGTGNYTGTLKKTFKIIPKGTSITNIVYGSGHIAVKWARQGVQTTGYQLQCSRNSTFTDIVHGYTIKNKAALSKTVYDLAAVKNYYLRVRTYKTVGEKRYYSVWSKPVKATLLNNIRIKGSGSTRTIIVYNPKVSYTSMKAAVWSEEGGQNDLKWYPMTKKDGAWMVSVPMAALRHSGLCNVHVYKGKTFIGSAEFTCTLTNTAITWDPFWEFADFSVVHTDSGYLYRAPSGRKGIVIGINAGHGTGDYTHYVYSHPDKTPKTTGGSTAAGSVYTMCDNYGMSFNDGAIEANVSLRQAEILRDLLLDNGYDVLMVRTQSTCGLDVIGRTVMCNNNADCHIALHWDGDGFGYDKGCFFTSVPDGIKNMYPTSTVWEKNNSLGENLINGLRSQGLAVFESGAIDIDLMQTSYSSIPSVDLELGNQCSPHDDGRLTANAKGILAGLNAFFS